MPPINTTDATCEWGRDPGTKQIWRRKSDHTVRYQCGEVLGSGWGGFAHLLIPDQEQKKSKVVKTTSKTLKKEYELSFHWPQNAVGLLLRP